MLESDRFWDALTRNLIFSAIILAIEIPLASSSALNMPKRGIGVPICLVLMALPLLIPWNVVGTIWQVFGRVDIGLLGARSPRSASTIITCRIRSTPGSR